MYTSEFGPCPSLSLGNRNLVPISSSAPEGWFWWPRAAPARSPNWIHMSTSKSAIIHESEQNRSNNHRTRTRVTSYWSLPSFSAKHLSQCVVQNSDSFQTAQTNRCKARFCFSYFQNVNETAVLNFLLTQIEKKVQQVASDCLCGPKSPLKCAICDELTTGFPTTTTTSRYPIKIGLDQPAKRIKWAEWMNDGGGFCGRSTEGIHVYIRWFEEVRRKNVWPDRIQIRYPSLVIRMGNSLEGSLLT